MKIFYVYRDAPERRAALAAAPGAPDRYRLFGLDELPWLATVTLAPVVETPAA